MVDDLNEKRDAIIEKAFARVTQSGWHKSVLEDAAQDAGYAREMADAVFPGGVSDAVTHFSGLADRRMLESLEAFDPDSLRVRDRIRQAVLSRLTVLAPYKDAVRYSMSYWALPLHMCAGASAVWTTADRIWIWAGDDAQDYNRYTKRGLLSGVLSATTLAWLNDESTDMTRTASFLDRRIENALRLGRFMGKVSGKRKAAG
jgi:ubiquinone biosynthesis protein COQ9